MTRPPMLRIFSAFTLTLALALAGCEESVDPIVGTDRVFSLYGVLQPQADTQWVRVYPIEERLEPAAAALAATFTSLELEDGTTHTWRDSVIEEADGQYAHVFWRPLRVAHDRTYRLDVTNEDDETAHVEVDVPPDASLVLQEPQADSEPILFPLLVDHDVPHLMRLEVTYRFQYDLRENVGANEDPTGSVTLSYDDAQQRDEAGWLIPVNLSEDFDTLRVLLGEAGLWNPQFGLVMRDMTLRLVVANEEWDPPDGVFDPDALVEPGTMSNVENGFGFVGAGYRLEKTWTPSIEVLTEAGWTDPNDV